MYCGRLIALTLVVSTSLAHAATRRARRSPEDEEAEVRKFLQGYDEDMLRLYNRATVASWNYKTNITEENSAASQAATLEVIKTAVGICTRQRLEKITMIMRRFLLLCICFMFILLVKEY